MLLTTFAAAILCMTGLRSNAAEAGLIRINGTIGPATADYISRAIKVAGARNNVCLIVELDTPGGLLESTKVIVQSFYASKVPVIVYVTPSGANAGSAGCFITLAADVAVMAPNTSIGAAHPVSIGGGGEQKTDDVMKKKLENFAASYIEAIADKRGRNVEWAKASVINSESITAEKALELHVIDFIAPDVAGLLQMVDGTTSGKHQLRTAGATTREIPQLLREKIFQVLWRPEVMMILMLAAIYGIIGELSNPGAVLPGTIGAIALLLALYMGSILPVNVAGVALIVLAVVLFIADIFATTHGVLTFGGIVSFFLGMVMLFNQADPAFRLKLSYIIPATLVTAAFFVFVIGAGLRAQRRPARTGKESMLGMVVPVLAPVSADGGKVLLEGEYWNAVSDVPVEAGDFVQITAVDGLTLKVKPDKTKQREG